MSERLTAVGLWSRGVAAAAGSIVIVAVIAAVLAGMVVAGGRETTSVLQEDLRYQLGTTSPTVRDLQSSTTIQNYSDAGYPVSIAGTVKQLPKFLSSVRAKMPAVLRNVTGRGRYVGRDAGQNNHGLLASGPPNQVRPLEYDYAIEANPDLHTDAVLVSGHWPGPVASGNSTAPTQLVTTVSAAKTLDWKVGQVEQMALVGYGQTQPVILVGTIRPRDSSADYWQLDPTRGQAGAIRATDGTLKGYFGTVWMDAASWPNLMVGYDSQSVTTWYPVTNRGLRVDQVQELGGDIQRFVSQPRTVGKGSANFQVRFVTNLDTVLFEYVARAGAGNALLDVVEAGPMGAGAALLLLAILSVVERRKQTTTLLRSRGASSRAFRLEIATHVATGTIPGAVVGAIVAAWATGGSIGVTPWLIAAAVALVPPLFAAAAAGSAPVVLTRGGVAKAGRWRWVTDAVLVLLAALAILVVLQRGLGSSNGLAADPLLTALPLVVSAAVCALILRAMPLALRGLASTIRRGRGVVGLVGRANSARTGARFLPVFAILTGLSVSVFASSILTTEQTGIRAAAIEQTGADISVTGASISAATITKLRELTGVQDLAAIHSHGGALLEGQSQSIAIYTVNARDLIDVEGVLPTDQQLFRQLGTRKDGKSVVYGGGFEIPLHSVSTFSDSTAPAVATITTKQTPPKFIGAVPWLLMDPAALPKDLHFASQTSAVLIRVAPGTDQAELQRQIAGIASRGDVIQVADTQVRALTSAPLIGGLEALTVAAIILSMILCVLALMLALITGTSERNRVLGRLRALGFSARQARGLVGWEIGPMTLLGIVAGVITGLALPLVFLSVVDLTTFIGSSQPPEFELNPVIIAAIVIAFALCALIAVLAATAISARGATYETLREAGE